MFDKIPDELKVIAVAFFAFTGPLWLCGGFRFYLQAASLITDNGGVILGLGALGLLWLAYKFAENFGYDPFGIVGSASGKISIIQNWETDSTTVFDGVSYAGPSHEAMQGKTTRPMLDAFNAAIAAGVPDYGPELIPFKTVVSFNNGEVTGVRDVYFDTRPPVRDYGDQGTYLMNQFLDSVNPPPLISFEREE